MTGSNILQVNQDLCEFFASGCLNWNNMPSIRRAILLAIQTFGRFIIWIVDPILRWLYDGCHRRLPHVTDPLLMKSGVELSRMIRAKEVRFLAFQCMLFCLSVYPHSFVAFMTYKFIIILLIMIYILV